MSPVVLDPTEVEPLLKLRLGKYGHEFSAEVVKLGDLPLFGASIEAAPNDMATVVLRVPAIYCDVELASGA